MNKHKLTLILCILLTIIMSIISFIAGKGLNSTGVAKSPVNEKTKEQDIKWTCSMHPQFKLPKPGLCPICAMDLIPLKPGENLGERELKLSKLAEKLASIEVRPVIRKNINYQIPLLGKIVFDETRSKKITARFDGRLDRLFVDYTGTEVAKGDHLFKIYSPELISAQEELAQSIDSAKAMKESSIKSIRLSSEKAVKAIKDKLLLWGITEKQIEKFISEKVIADHVVSYSPIEGVVIKKHVEEGSYVKEGETIYSINSLERVWLELDAYEGDLKWLTYGQQVTFTSEVWPGEEFKGKIDFIHHVLNPKTRTLKIRVNVENEECKLKPNMFVKAIIKVPVSSLSTPINEELIGKWISPMHPEIISDKPGKCTICNMDLIPISEFVKIQSRQKGLPLIIPSSAPLITGKRAIVYIRSKSKEGYYFGREVKLGAKVGDYYIVQEGLQEGELVVTRGAFKIDSALQVLAKPSMMSLTENIDKTFETTLSFKKSLNDFYSSYVKISTLLSKDSINNITEKTEAMVLALKSVDANKEKAEISAQWKKLSRELELASNLLKYSKTIKDARVHFEKVSSLSIKIVKAFGTTEDINLAYCSMAFKDKGAYWLQKASEIENPYFGDEMFHCGDIKEKFTIKVPKSELSEKNKDILAKSFNEYLILSEQLASDKKPQIGVYNKILKTLQTVSMENFTEETHLVFMKELNSIQSAIINLKEDSDIKVHRLSFEKISNSFISFIEMFSFLKKDSFVFKCPMAFEDRGAKWLQLDDKTKNPFMGLKMQSCGDVQSKFNALVPNPVKQDVKPPVKADHSKKKIEEKKEVLKHDHSEHKMPKISTQALAVYFKIHKALSQDRFPETGKDVLVKALTDLKSEGDILKATNKIYTAKDIKVVRGAFKTLSDYLIKKANEGSLSSDTNLAHCPMAFEGKGGFWLQAEDKVENPYFGNRMYRCGAIKKKISGGK